MMVRKITSLTLLIAFSLLILTSIILYIVPQGRIAFWVDWHLWGLTKTQWGNLHINLGVLVLVSGLVHVYYNWRALVAYMKNRAKQIKVFTPSFTVALMLTLGVVVGTYYEIAPMGSIISLGEAIKERAAIKYGEPPYGHAELSPLTVFARKQGLDLELSMTLLKGAGLVVGGDNDTIAEIADHNGLIPQQVYAVIKPALKDEISGKDGLPESPPPGFGNMTLGAVCSEYNLSLPEVIRGLNANDIKAEAGMTIKQMAHANGISPMAVFERLRGLDLP
jgi:hypothetical protein